MKRSLLLLTGIIFCTNLFSQTQIGNSNFESWEVTTSEIAEPVNWNSFKTASGSWNTFAGQQMRNSSSVRPGSTGVKSAVIWSRNAGFGVIANGNMTLGRIEMGSTTASDPANYNYSSTGDANFSEVMTDSPDSIVFWVKYKPVTAGSNTARISTIIHNNTNNYKDPNDVAGSNTVATAILNFSTTSNSWVRKSVPFTYVGTPSNAAFIITTFTTNSVPGGGSANDSLWIDDVELIYNPANQPVIANGDVATTFEDVWVDIAVLDNDTDPENDFDNSSVTVTVGPSNGTTSVNPGTGVITYTPDPGFFGSDSFTYEVCDNGTPVLCDTAVVNITVIEVVAGNNQIVVNPDVAVTDMNVAVTTDVVANDSDFENQIDLSTLTVTVQGTNGTAVANTLTGEITYTPDLDFFGTDSYTYSLCDSGTPSITCGNAEVSVTVNLTWGLDNLNSNVLTFSLNGNELSILDENVSGSYSVYSVNGTVIQSGTIEKKLILNDTKGVYFIHFDSSNGSFMKKIVIL